MTKIFEGQTEQDAIAKAMVELGLEQSEFDVELLNEEKKGFFKKAVVKIRVHYGEIEQEPEAERQSIYKVDLDFENQVKIFVETLIKKMGFDSILKMTERTQEKVFFEINSPNANLLIGKYGKNLDALQLLANIHAGRIFSGEDRPPKIVLDSEDYRNRREDHLVRLAIRVAQQVRRERVSMLLEPMNPFERRLIHTSLAEMKDIKTESEGEGLIKQVRISLTNFSD